MAGARLTIGEFSVMARLSRKALRHYHELGLLEPDHVDPVNGYRRYDTSQVPVAHIIRRFRDLGMSVPDIKAVLATDDLERRNEIIGGHLREMETQLRQTREAVGALRELLEPGEHPIDVTFRSVPATPAWAVTETVRLDRVSAWFREAMREIRAQLAAAGAEPAGDPGGLYAPELFTEEVGEATVFVPTAAVSGTTGRVAVAAVPAAELAVTVHRGPESSVDRTYGALGGYVAERLLMVDGPVREYYPARAAGGCEATGTEICWPVFRTARP